MPPQKNNRGNGKPDARRRNNNSPRGNNNRNKDNNRSDVVDMLNPDGKSNLKTASSFTVKLYNNPGEKQFMQALLSLTHDATERKDLFDYVEKRVPNLIKYGWDPRAPTSQKEDLLACVAAMAGTKKSKSPDADFVKSKEFTDLASQVQLLVTKFSHSPAKASQSSSSGSSSRSSAGSASNGSASVSSPSSSGLISIGTLAHTFTSGLMDFSQVVQYCDAHGIDPTAVLNSASERKKNLSAANGDTSSSSSSTSSSSTSQPGSAQPVAGASSSLPRNEKFSTPDHGTSFNDSAYSAQSATSVLSSNASDCELVVAGADTPLGALQRQRQKGPTHPSCLELFGSKTRDRLAINWMISELSLRNKNGTIARTKVRSWFASNTVALTASRIIIPTMPSATGQAAEREYERLAWNAARCNLFVDATLRNRMSFPKSPGPRKGKGKRKARLSVLSEQVDFDPTRSPHANKRDSRAKPVATKHGDASRGSKSANRRSPRFDSDSSPGFTTSGSDRGSSSDDSDSDTSSGSGSSSSSPSPSPAASRSSSKSKSGKGSEGYQLVERRRRPSGSSKSSSTSRSDRDSSRSRKRDGASSSDRSRSAERKRSRSVPPPRPRSRSSNLFEALSDDEERATPKERRTRKERTKKK